MQTPEAASVATGHARWRSAKCCIAVWTAKDTDRYKHHQLFKVGKGINLDHWKLFRTSAFITLNLNPPTLLLSYVGAQWPLWVWVGSGAFMCKSHINTDYCSKRRTSDAQVSDEVTRLGYCVPSSQRVWNSESLKACKCLCVWKEA